MSRYTAVVRTTGVGLLPSLPPRREGKGGVGGGMGGDGCFNPIRGEKQAKLESRNFCRKQKGILVAESQRVSNEGPSQECKRLFRESQGRNLVLTVLLVPY